MELRIKPQFGHLIIICLCALVVFAPVVRYGFTNWDDDTHLTENRLVRSVHPRNIKKIFAGTVHDTYIPLTILSFAVEYHFFGFNPFVYHLDNVLLHLLNGMLIYLLIWKWGCCAQTAACAAIIFAIHPMHVESVTWVTERKDVLYAFFYLLALHGYRVYCQTKKISFYLLSFLSAVLSMLAKPMAISLPLILILMDWYMKRSFSKEAVYEKIPYFLGMIPLGWITYTLHARIPGREAGEAVLIWIWSLAFYIRQFVLPINLVPLYELPQPVALSQFTYVLAIAIVILTMTFLLRYYRQRWFVFGFLYFFLSIFFLLRFDQTGDVNVVADRFIYLPSIGFCVILANFWQKSCQSGTIRRRAATACLILFTIGLAAKTYAQNRIWQNNEVLWNHVIRHAPEKTIAYNNRGHYYLQNKQYDKAIRDFYRASELHSQNDSALTNLGLAYNALGRYELALQFFKKSLALNPENPKAYNNRGITYQNLEQMEAAITQYSRAISLDPEYTEAYINRGNAKSIMADYEAAYDDYHAALRLEPSNHYAHYGQGIVYLWGRKQYDKAMAKFNLTLKINPRYARAYFYRSKTFLQLQNISKALADALKARDLGFSEQGYIEQLEHTATGPTGQGSR